MGNQKINTFINYKISCVNSTVKGSQWGNVIENDKRRELDPCLDKIARPLSG